MPDTFVRIKTSNHYTLSAGSNAGAFFEKESAIGIATDGAGHARGMLIEVATACSVACGEQIQD